MPILAIGSKFLKVPKIARSSIVQAHENIFFNIVVGYYKNTTNKHFSILTMSAKREILSSRYKQTFSFPKGKRKINPEFTSAIRAAKLIRTCAEMMPPDRNRFYRLSKFILHDVIHKDTEQMPGERKIYTQHLTVFEGYEFDPDHAFLMYMPADIFISVKNTIHISIPKPIIHWPQDCAYCKIMVRGVKVDFHSFTTVTESVNSSWIKKHELPVLPIHIEIGRQSPLFVAIGIAYANSENAPISCRAVRILAIIQ